MSAHPSRALLRFLAQHDLAPRDVAFGLVVGLIAWGITVGVFAMFADGGGQ